MTAPLSGGNAFRTIGSVAESALGDAVKRKDALLAELVVLVAEIERLRLHLDLTDALTQRNRTEKGDK